MTPQTLPVFQKGLEFFSSLLPEGSKIVDIYLDKGIYTEALVKRGYEVTVFDQPVNGYLNRPIYFQQVLRDLGDTVHYIPKDLESVVLPFRSVDGIWAQQAFATMPPELLSHYLHILYDWLRVDGLLYLSVWEGDGVKQISLEGLSKNPKKRKHYYQPEQLDQLLKLEGFEAIQAWYEGPVEKRSIHVIAKRA